MIGSKYIIIDWKNWAQGMTTSNFTEDGGFGKGTGGASSSAVNPIASPGLMHFPAASVDKSGTLEGEIIMSCEDSQSVSPADKIVVSKTASGAGAKFYKYKSGTLTIASTNGTDSTRTYEQGMSDMTNFGGYVYGTSRTAVFEYVTSSGTVTQSYYDLTASYSNANLVPHPVLVYENNLFYGNGNKLLRQTDIGVAPVVILTLDTQQVIVALGIDPGSGLMFISTSNVPNIDGTLTPIAKVLYYDGFSNKPRKSVIVDDMITCFYTVGGTVFIGYGQNIGYWTGTGIQFLRALNISLDRTQLLFKHHITNLGSVLYILENEKILAYGEVIQGQGKSWWYLYLNYPSGSSVTISSLFDLPSNKLGYSFSSAKFYTIDTSSTSDKDTNALLFSRKYNFPRPVTFNSVVIDYGSTITASTTIATVYLFLDNGDAPLIATVTTTQSGTYTFTCPYPTAMTRSIQIRYSPSTNLGIEKATIFYNDKE